MMPGHIRRIILTSLSGLILLGTGCSGGGTAPGNAGNQAGTPPPPPPVTAIPQPQQRPAAGLLPAGSKKSTTPRTGLETSTGGEPTANQFVVLEGQEHLALQPPGQVSLRDEFEVFLPASGTNFSSVSVIWPEGSEPTRRLDAAAATQDSRLPAGYSVVLPAEAGSNGLPPRIRCDLDGSEMVLIPAGVFLQGADQGPEDCRPQHPAFVSSFYIDVTEVTLGQFERFQQRQKELKKAVLPAPKNAGDDPQKPVLGISWKDAELYARHIGKELPTESEWEKAARGPRGFPFPWGDSRPAWNAPRHLGQINVAGMFNSDRSPYGVFDMAGNAREWVADWYSPDIYQSATEKDGSPIRDSKGAPRADVVGRKVVKGGKSGWEVWQRNHAPMRDGYPDIGFRCVLRIPDSTGSAGETTATVRPTPPSPQPPATPAAPVGRPSSGF